MLNSCFHRTTRRGGKQGRLPLTSPAIVQTLDLYQKAGSSTSRYFDRRVGGAYSASGPRGTTCARNRFLPVPDSAETDFAGSGFVMVRKLVYVVDDDAAFLRAIQRLLNEHGYDVAVFQSVEDFNGHAVLDDAFCLVLDINLGDSSGIDLGWQLSKRGSSLPVIFITANDSESTRKATHELGCVAYLRKPFPAKSLIDAVESSAAQSGQIQ
jgi:CheY-like chemotaxis protein